MVGIKFIGRSAFLKKKAAGFALQSFAKAKGFPLQSLTQASAMNGL